MRNTTVLCLLLLSARSFAQMDSNKSGDITSGGQVVAEVQKYGGTAETKPKFRVVNSRKDTLMLINFKKDLGYDWMQFRFAGQEQTIEVEYNEIISGMNYRKNLGSFLVKSNLIAPDGRISDTALQTFLAKHNENLTDKYYKLNESERKLAGTRFDYTPENNNYVQINGRPVGVASLPDVAGAEVNN